MSLNAESALLFNWVYIGALESNAKKFSFLKKDEQQFLLAHARNLMVDSYLSAKGGVPKGVL